MGKKIIAAADLHLDSTMVGHWDAKAGMHGNWVESFARLDDVVRVCNEESADLLVIARSEEHTSELQSRFDLVCRLLLEKKNKIFLILLLLINLISNKL